MHHNIFIYCSKMIWIYKIIMPKSGSKNGRIAPEKSANTENGVAMNGKRAGIIII